MLMDSVGREFGKNTVEMARLGSKLSVALARKTGMARAGGFTSQMTSSHGWLLGWGT